MGGSDIVAHRIELDRSLKLCRLDQFETFRVVVWYCWLDDRILVIERGD